MNRTHLPSHLHAAYDWTAAAGELDELRRLTGDELRTYCRESADNSQDHALNSSLPADVVTEAELNELHDWLTNTIRFAPRSRVVIIRLDVRTTLDDQDLEERLVSFLDPLELQESLLDDERIELVETRVDVQESQS